MATFKKTLTIKGKDYWKVQSALRHSGNMKDGEFGFCVDFGNGVSMCINLMPSCDPAEGAWVQAFLRTEEDDCFAEVAEDRFFDGFRLTWDGDTYIVEVSTGAGASDDGVPFSVRKVPAGENEAFPGIGKATYAIAGSDGLLSVEGIADELGIRGTHAKRMEKVIEVLAGADPAVLNSVYFVYDGDPDYGDLCRRMFIDPYFLTEKGCRAAVDELNRMYLAKVH